MKKDISLIRDRINQGFESDTHNTPEFKAFASLFKKLIKAEIESVGGELVKFSVGHFYVSGFYKYGDRYGYFSLSDVRYGSGFMFRTANDTKDFRGGTNNSGELEPGLGRKMVSLLS